MFRSQLNLISAVSLAFAIASPALAQDIQLGEPSYGGTGCPGGSASASVGPDGKTVTILFDQYVAEAGGSTGKRLDRKSCNIAIPVHVPNGYSVSIFQMDYRGYNYLPAGARSQFNVEYFWAGSTGPRLSKSWAGRTDAEYLVNHGLIASALVWSRCGESVTLRSNASMTVFTNSRREQALSTVDSADVQAGLVYHFQFRRCTNYGDRLDSASI